MKISLIYNTRNKLNEMLNPLPIRVLIRRVSSMMTAAYPHLKDIEIALDAADDEDNRLPYGIGFGIYRYEFRWDGQPYIDPMDGRDYLNELTAGDLDEICAELAGLRTVGAVMRALDEMDINWFLPVKISGSVPPRDIRYLYNAYDAMCDAIGVKGRFYGGKLPARNPNGRS